MVLVVDVEEAGFGLANVIADAIQELPGQFLIAAALVGDSIPSDHQLDATVVGQPVQFLLHGKQTAVPIRLVETGGEADRVDLVAQAAVKNGGHPFLVVLHAVAPVVAPPAAPVLPSLGIGPVLRHPVLEVGPIADMDAGQADVAAVALKQLQERHDAVERALGRAAHNGNEVLVAADDISLLAPGGVAKKLPVRLVEPSVQPFRGCSFCG